MKFSLHQSYVGLGLVPLVRRSTAIIDAIVTPALLSQRQLSFLFQSGNTCNERDTCTYLSQLCRLCYDEITDVTLFTVMLLMVLNSRCRWRHLLTSPFRRRYDNAALGCSTVGQVARPTLSVLEQRYNYYPYTVT